MQDPLALSDQLWRGEVAPEEVNPFAYWGDLIEITSSIAFVPSFANVTACKTNEGLVLVDTGSPMFANAIHEQVRRWSDDALNTAVYTHGHIDHVFGVAPFEAEDGPTPRVVAHALVPGRFQRYEQTAGYNALINRRQFRLPDLQWPTEYRYPDETYDHSLDLEVGGRAFALTHGKGETDDATWVWIEDEKVLCCGDFFIWASPNAGNPQKAQRYPAEWARALRAMTELGAETLLPGHGVPIVGAERVRTALEDSAELLESLVAQTLDMINAGARLDAIVHTVRAPEHLLEKPYLRPTYDEPEFIVRNIWRLYAGWYDGDPATLKPAGEAAVAEEVCGLAGGAPALAKRATELADSGDLRLASRLAEWALIAAPKDEDVKSAHSQIFSARAQSEASTMAKGIFSWAADERHR
jgi:alkyl sulfatase BDS1-like metallo-beta-lactamase superfamily hydrolase